MRRLGTLVLLAGLALLALLLVWLVRGVPGTARPDEPSAPTAPGDETVPLDRGRPEPVEPEASKPSARDEVAPGGAPSADRPRGAQGIARVIGRLVDRSHNGVAEARVLAANALDVGQATPIETWWSAHLPLDVADPAALGVPTPITALTDE